MPRAPRLAPERRRPLAPSRAPLRRVAVPRRRRFRLLGYAIIAAVWGILALAVMLLWFARDLPRPEAALDAARRPSLALQDRTGRVFATFGDIVGDPLRLNDMPPSLPAAAVAVEDRRFWHHPGIDPIGLARAVWVNVTSGRLAQGGSTITQQVAKNLFLTNARTFRRKVQELLLTLWLEHSFNKREILEIWLNRVYLGSGTWGVDAAARMYFGILGATCDAVAGGGAGGAAARAVAVQSARRSGRGRGPCARGADRHGEHRRDHRRTGARRRRRRSRFRRAPPLATGWFADWVAEQAQALIPANADTTLRTTLDARLQAIAESRLTALLDGPGAAAGVTQGAVVALDAATGAVHAMVGGRDYRQSPFNRAVLARRQPGSAFKPFTWLAALEKGVRPDDTVLDAPIRIGNWSPADFERRYLGEITVEEALAQSINTAAVRLLLQAGGPRVVARLAARLGIGGKLPNDASLALGTGEVGLLELASSYAALFNGGARVTPFGVEALRTAPQPVVDPDLAAMMVRMMTAVVTRGTGRAAAVPGHLVAGKTGTTQDYRDAWFIGCIDGEIIGVWLGNDDNRPMKSVQGGGLPARLFHDIAISR